MSMFKTYSIANDTLNGTINSAALHDQLTKDATLLDKVDGVNRSQGEDAFDIYLLIELTPALEAAMDAVVAAHDGTALPEEVQHVLVDNTIVTDKGRGDFDTLVSHNWIDNTTWPGTNDSVWINEASSSTKQLVIPKAEVQFTHDVKMKTATTASELYFDVWAYNPLFDQGQAPTAEDPAFIPGVSSGNPLRFLVSRKVFASLKDVFDLGNDHYTMPVAVDGLPSGVSTVRFDYDQKIVLRGDQGAQIRFSLKDDSPMEGGVNSFCTVSIVVREEDIDS